MSSLSDFNALEIKRQNKKKRQRSIKYKLISKVDDLRRSFKEFLNRNKVIKVIEIRYRDERYFRIIPNHKIGSVIMENIAEIGKTYECFQNQYDRVPSVLDELGDSQLESLIDSKKVIETDDDLNLLKS